MKIQNDYLSFIFQAHEGAVGGISESKSNPIIKKNLNIASPHKKTEKSLKDSGDKTLNDGMLSHLPNINSLFN